LLLLLGKKGFCLPFKIFVFLAVITLSPVCLSISSLAFFAANPPALATCLLFSNPFGSRLYRSLKLIMKDVVIST